MSLDTSSAKSLENLRRLRQQELQQWVARYFRDLRWDVREVPPESHGCNLLLTASVHGEPVLVGVHVEAGRDVAERLDASGISDIAQNALAHRYGSDGRERLYKYYWITTGQVGPTARDEILRRLEKSGLSGRVDVWDMDGLFAKFRSAGLLKELEHLAPALRVFVSYASEDRDKVSKLCQRLRAEGFRPWWDKEILPGQDWQLVIRQALRNSDAAIACLSGSAVRKRGYVHQELKMALDLHKQEPEGSIYLIPVLLEEQVDLPESLRELRLHWTFLDDEGYQSLVRALRHREKQLQAAGRALAGNDL